MADIYVATDGDDDAGDGTIGNPYATIDKARLMARTMPNVPVWVFIRGGVYTFTSSLALTADDSRSSSVNHITYINYGSETVRIIGAQLLDPDSWVLSSTIHDAIWDRITDAAAKAGCYQIDLTAETPTITDYGSLADRAMELYFNDAPMRLARYPNKNTTSATRIANGATQFDITNTTGTTFRYTYDGTGTNPNISAVTMPVGTKVLIRGQSYNVTTFPSGMNASNRGYFEVTGSGDNYFEVTNPVGVEETNRTIGIGYIQKDASFALYNTGTNGNHSTTQDNIVYFGADRSWMADCTSDAYDAYVYGFFTHDYAGYHQQIDSIDTDNNIINLVDTVTGDMKSPEYGISNGGRYYLYNIPGELDEAGEYYIDRANGVLYFYPPSTITASDSYVSLFDTPLITLTSCNYTTFQGLTIALSRGQALLASTCDHLVVKDCTIRNIGGKRTGTVADRYKNFAIAIRISTNCEVNNCSIYNCAEGGIWMTGVDRTSTTNNTIVGNTIYDIMYYNRCSGPAGIMLNSLFETGVSLTGLGDRIAHNLIHDIPGIGIMINGNSQVIEYNTLYNVCEDTSDVSAIYTGTVNSGRNRVIRYNYIHDVVDSLFSYMHGVYFDASASWADVYGNIFNNIETAVYVNGGSEVLQENNLYINSVLRDIWYWSASAADLGNKILCCIHYAPSTDCVMSSQSGLTQTITQTNNFSRGNPLFTDFAGGDYSLQITSPLWSFGWQAIPISDITVASTAIGSDWTFSLPTLVWTETKLKANFEDGLLAWFTLDSIGQNTTIDSSTYARVGTLTDPAYDGITYVAGKKGYAISLNNDDSYIAIPTETVIASAHHDRTVALWMKSSHSSGTVNVICFTNSYLGLRLANQTPQVVLGASNLKAFQSAADYLDGTWHLWVIALPMAGETRVAGDTANIKLYIDNVEIAVSGTPSTGSLSSWGSPRIGGYADNTGIVGVIDEVGIWSRILTEAERTKVYNRNIYKKRRPLPFL